ncbi:hypothetical protein ACFLQX_01600, partial [Bacteroidota bacterium]
IPLASNAQTWRLVRYEAGLGIGTTHSFMDIGSEKDGLRSFSFRGTRPNVFFDASFLILEDLAVQLDLGYIQLAGRDSDARTRDLSFVTNSFEPVVRVEYSIIGGGRTFGSTALFNRRGMVNDYNTLNLYAFAGAGGILTKAKVKDINGDEVVGNPSYDNNLHFGAVFPMGLGLKYQWDSDWAIGLEIGGRFSTSDLLDGYWNQTASQYKDRYILTNVKAIYKIRNDRRGVPQFSRYRRR